MVAAALLAVVLMGGGLAAKWPNGQMAKWLHGAGDRQGVSHSGTSPETGRGERATELPRVVVERAGTVISESCEIVIPPGTVLADAGAEGGAGENTGAAAKGAGAIVIKGSGLVVKFAPGSILRGAPAGTAPEAMSGVGVSVVGGADVTIEGLVATGYRVGLSVRKCDGVTITDCSFDDLARAKLKSTAQAEDQADWLWPHENDEGQWLSRYGAAVVIAASDRAEVRRVTVRRGQNGIMLDGVNRARIFDNDCSFLSGWGLSMWRSSKNTVARNAFDFCVRGYSHGVYNRGQDSAGILMFEQCSENTIAENSATHCGDGLFVFAGKDALGETGDANRSRERAGCNDNVIVGNDFSYAAAHGVEVTFGFDNRISGNTLVGCGICGIWGGYSQRTVIDGNTIEANGLPGAKEGGGINIEHGYANRISGNHFARNSQGVSLWWDPDVELMKTPWAKANHKGSMSNAIVGNTFDAESRPVVVRLSRGTVVEGNTVAGGGKLVDTDDQSEVREGAPGKEVPGSPTAVIADWPGTARPVGKRAALGGRQAIVLTEYGPWDHQAPLFREVSDEGWMRVYELFNPPASTQLNIELPDDVTEEQVFGQLTPPEGEGQPVRLAVKSAFAGLWPYRVRVRGEGYDKTLEGTLINSLWTARFFPWIIDPRTDVDGWRAEGRGDRSVECELPRMVLKFGYAGPSGMKLGEAVTAAKLPSDRFGLIASTVIPLAPGRYRITTMSDDGVRVRVKVGGGVDELGGAAGEARGGAKDGGKLEVISNWTVHGPTRDVGEFVVAGVGAGGPGAGAGGVAGEREADGAGGAARVPVLIEVEYFEVDGFATLEVGVMAVK